MEWAAILQTASVVIAAATAVWGINSWRHEFVGKKRIDLAEEVLARFYEARDVIGYIRSPAGFKDEGSTREPRDNETDREKELLDRAYVPHKRYLDHQAVFSQLFPLRYRFMSQFGVEAGAPFQEIQRILSEIFIAADDLSDYWLNQGYKTWSSEEERQEHLTGMKESQAIIWDRFNRNDPIRPRLDDAVSVIETICKNVQPRSMRLRLPFGKHK